MGTSPSPSSSSRDPSASSKTLEDTQQRLHGLFAKTKQVVEQGQIIREKDKEDLKKKQSLVTHASPTSVKKQSNLKQKKLTKNPRTDNTSTLISDSEGEKILVKHSVQASIEAVKKAYNTDNNALLGFGSPNSANKKKKSTKLSKSKMISKTTARKTKNKSSLETERSKSRNRDHLQSKSSNLDSYQAASKSTTKRDKDTPSTTGRKAGLQHQQIGSNSLLSGR